MDNALDKYLNDVLNPGTESLMDQYNDKEMAFTAYVLGQLSELLNYGDPVVTHVCKKKRDGSVLGEIYAYAMSRNSEVLTLFYTLYSDSVKSYNNDEYEKCITRLRGFLTNVALKITDFLEVDDPLYEPCCLIAENYENVQTINFCVISNGKINKKEEVKNKKIVDKHVNYDYWDIRRLYNQFCKESDHVEIDIDFSENGEWSKYKIPFIAMESDQIGYKCILAMFPAKLLYELYEKHNTALLQNNVRYFLGFTKSKKNANNGMLETLKSEESQMFLAYNNGITAVAKDFDASFLGDKTEVGEKEQGESDKKEYIRLGTLNKISDFQIVNGGQTTAAIFYAKKQRKNKSIQISFTGIYIQVKLIIIGDEKKGRLIKNITKFSNSQSNIKYSDFSVSNEFNMKMQELSRTIYIPTSKFEHKYWFFERLRGQLEHERNNGTRADISHFDVQYPKDKRFKKEEMAKVWKSWEQTPYDAVKGEGTNYDLFITDKTNNKFIPDEIYYKKTIALLIIYKFLMSRPENKEYGNKKATIIAYAIAYLGYATDKKLDLLKIWERQDISEMVRVYLDVLCEKLSDLLDRLAAEKGKTVLSYGKTKEAYELVIEKMNLDSSSLKSDFVQ